MRTFPVPPVYVAIKMHSFLFSLFFLFHPLYSFHLQQIRQIKIEDLVSFSNTSKHHSNTKPQPPPPLPLNTKMSSSSSPFTRNNITSTPSPEQQLKQTQTSHEATLDTLRKQRRRELPPARHHRRLTDQMLFSPRAPRRRARSSRRGSSGHRRQALQRLRRQHPRQNDRRAPENHGHRPAPEVRAGAGDETASGTSGGGSEE